MGHVPPPRTHTQGSSASPTPPTEISLPIPIWLRFGFIPLPTCQIIASAGCVLKGHSRACSSYQIVLLGDSGGQGMGRHPERGHLAIAPTSTISPCSKIFHIQEVLRPRYDEAEVLSPHYRDITSPIFQMGKLRLSTRPRASHQPAAALSLHQGRTWPVGRRMEVDGKHGQRHGQRHGQSHQPACYIKWESPTGLQWHFTLLPAEQLNR